MHYKKVFVTLISFSTFSWAQAHSLVKGQQTFFDKASDFLTLPVILLTLGAAIIFVYSFLTLFSDNKKEAKEAKYMLFISLAGLISVTASFLYHYFS